MAVGLAMLRKQLAEVLEAEGLTEILAVGQTLKYGTPRSSQLRRNGRCLRKHCGRRNQEGVR